MKTGPHRACPMRRCLAVLLVLEFAALGGCGIPAPAYPKLSSDEEATFEPDFDPTAGQRGRWLCDDFDLVLLQDAQRGLVLFEMNRSYVMKPRKTLAGGGHEFEFGEYYGMRARIDVPDDPTVGVDLNTTTWGGAYDYLTKQRCPPAPPVKVFR